MKLEPNQGKKPEVFMKIIETIKLFFSKAAERRPTANKIQTLLPSFAQRKIHLIYEGKEKLKKECYHELEEMLLDA